ncbi:hypothetical protein [Streptomyces sp. NPDC048001]|uniref:hypothetical protein n=1 Tax=Streptomyces sp. NPDC048001 TaxID=3365498 RepID=UPI0037227B30
MSEITDTTPTVHEAYSFACMRCGYGWEQSYEIEHHVDTKGRAFVVYRADGERVPSPLSSPTCLNCGGHVVRIMRAGSVSTVQEFMEHGHDTEPHDTEPHEDRPAAAASVPAPAAEEPRPSPEAAPTGRHRRLSDLLHPFHHRR